MTNFTVWLPLLSAIVGLLMFCFCEGKANSIGATLFWTGWLAFLLTASHAITFIVK